MPSAAKTCGSCGATGQLGAFCDECGETLPDAAALAPAPSVAPIGEQPAWDAPDDDTLDLFPAESSSSGQTLFWDSLVSSASDRQSAPVPDSGERARALIVPVEDPVAAGRVGTPASPVLPGRPEPVAPSAVRMPESDVPFGGQPCPWCTMPNPVDRHFCRRCAMSLAAQPGAVRRPWWRRLLDWRHRPVPYAGQRPRLRRNPGQLARWIVTLAIAGVLVIAGVVWGGAAVAAVEDHFAHPSIVFASTVTASHSDPKHPVGNVHDSHNNTWWGTGETGDGSGVHVDAAFAQPIGLLDVVITPGAGISQDTFTAQSRPQTILVTLTNADGATTSSTLTLPDSPGPKTFAIHGSDVTSIRFTIESAYLASTGQGTEVAIAEIEFFAKS